MWLYNALLYLVLILFFPVFAVLYIFNIAHMRDRFALLDPDAIDSRKSILIHGASLGEIGIIKKILPEVVKKYPGHPVIVSATTPAGRDNILSSMPELISHAVFLPLEFRFCVRRFLRLANPAIVVIIETELWPNFIFESRKSGARLVLINGRISEKSFPRYMMFRWLFRKTLAAFDAIGVQNREYFNRFLKIGAEPSALAVTGNIKSSLKSQKVSDEEKRGLRESLLLGPGKRIIIAASTRPGEEELVLEALAGLQDRFPALFLILAPRHLNRVAEVESILKNRAVSYIKRSAPPARLDSERVLVLDTLGELARLFCLAEAAFIGGTLKDFGGHNLLEPLPFQVPVCFGPFHATQKESARLILSNNCGAQVDGPEALSAFIGKVLSDAEYQTLLKANIREILDTSDACINANLNLI
jgi:3-deoxy-D-manno-octulosonic-acid transferase